MKKVLVLSLALVIGFALVMAITLTMDSNGKEARAMEKVLEATFKIRIDQATGEIAITDEEGNPLDKVGEEISLDELEKIYKHPDGVKHVSTILYFHRSPGCFVSYYNGRPFVYPSTCRDRD